MLGPLTTQDWAIQQYQPQNRFLETSEQIFVFSQNQTRNHIRRTSGCTIHSTNAANTCCHLILQNFLTDSICMNVHVYEFLRHEATPLQQTPFGARSNSSCGNV
ncbi:TPA: hypothetical protein ACH3X1_014007 [Trebouxia sp. C0004]